MPLYETYEERIKELRDWARTRARPGDARRPHGRPVPDALMFAAKRASGEPIHLFKAQVSLALMATAIAGFAVSLALGSGASNRRDAAMERAGLYYREHPYLTPPLSVLLEIEADNAPTFDASALDASAVRREQTELEAIVAEANAAEREMPAYRVGLFGGGTSLQRFALHPFVHAGLLHLAFTLGLLASAGARLELTLGRARFAALALGSAVAGAGLHLAASAPEAAPFVGLSALVAGIAGAFAVRPGDVARDPLALGAVKPRRSPIRAAAILGLLACALCSLLDLSAPSFAPIAQLGGFGGGALAMFGFVRARWIRDPVDDSLAPAVSQAMALLREGDAPSALESLRTHLASGANDPLAARALGFAVRGRSDAPEVLARAFFAAVDAQRRELAMALFRECAALGALPANAGAQLRSLAVWLRTAGSAGEARIALLASLADADAATAGKIARDSRRADPVLALRAAERALGFPSLSEAERRALTELVAQTRKDAQGAGVIVLDAAREAEAAAQRAAAKPPAAAPMRAARAPHSADPALEAGDAGALDLEAPDATPPPPTAELTEADDEGVLPADSQDQNQAFFERGAIDLASPEPEPLELPDPELAGDAALLDALHRALACDGADLAAQLADDALELDRGERQSEDSAPQMSLVAAAPAPSPVAPSGSAPIRTEDFAFGDGADDPLADEKPEPAPPRPLRVSAATPQRLGAEAIVVEIEGRGRAKLAYTKIDAVSAAGVKGISESGKAVLLIDLVIGWGAGDGELRVVRMRADAFDPRSLVEGQSSPLAALRALVAELRTRTRGMALPSESAANAPFRIYADLASYEREALGAEQR